MDPCCERRAETLYRECIDERSLQVIFHSFWNGEDLEFQVIHLNCPTFVCTQHSIAIKTSSLPSIQIAARIYASFYARGAHNIAGNKINGRTLVA